MTLLILSREVAIMAESNMKPKWLVEIRLKDWEPNLSNGSRIVAYEEVEAFEEYHARHLGFRQFETRFDYEPALRRKMREWCITPSNCCAPEAVLL